MRISIAVYGLAIVALAFLSNVIQAQELSVFKKKKDRYGYRFEHNDESVIKAKFEKAFPFKNGVARVVKRGKWGLINREGKYLQRPSFSYILPFDQLGYARFCEGGDEYGFGGKWGVLNEEGKIVLEPVYDYISAFSSMGIAKVAVGGAMQKTGSFEYARLVDLEPPYPIIGEDLIIVEKAEDWQEAPQDGDEEEWDEEGQVPAFSYWDNGKWGLVNTDGKVIVAPVYTQIGNLPVANKLSHKEVVKVCLDCQIDLEKTVSAEEIVWKGGKQGFINVRTGAEFLPIKYGYIDADLTKFGADVANNQWVVSDGSRHLEVDLEKGLRYWDGVGKVGIVDAVTGKELLPVAFDELQPFLSGVPVAEQVLPVGKTDPKTGFAAYGFADASGKMISDYNANYNDVILMKSTPLGIAATQELHYCVVRYDDSFQKNNKGLINQNGKVILPQEYQEVKSLSDGKWLVYKDDIAVVFDHTGKKILEGNYSEVFVAENVICAYRNGKWVCLDKEGVEQQDCNCDQLTEGKEKKVGRLISDEVQVMIGYGAAGYTVFDPYGNVLIDEVFEQAFVKDGKICTLKQGNWKCYALSGKSLESGCDCGPVKSE
ncbi:WG repeat-containing protein [Limibacter armeniacum]|uniref:WG repeat-containing protein n=1 Tax=Limibacter armeniacum TaxID=466084 RepID=UPI002FE64668